MTIKAKTSDAVKERPILMSGPMVRQILAGRKTMTRRVMRPRPGRCGDRMKWCPPGAKYVPATGEWAPVCIWDASRPVMETGAAGIVEHCPLGRPGDRLWVRESFSNEPFPDGREAVVYRANFDVEDGFGSEVIDLKTGELAPLLWRPSIHMPRRLSRITLEITDVRVERVQDIRHDGVMAEGCPPECEGQPSGIEGDPGNWSGPDRWFRSTWEAIHGPGSWDTNPFVWCLSFRRIDQSNSH